MKRFNIKLYEWLTFHCVSMAYDAACTVCQVTECCVETGLVLCVVCWRGWVEYGQLVGRAGFFL
jgi:hypothetical protein